MSFNFFESLESRSLFSAAVPASPLIASAGSITAAVHVSPSAAKAPTATLSAKAIKSAVSSYKFSVTYKSATKINAATIATGNVEVTGPGGYKYVAKLVSISPTTNATTIVATYKIAPKAASTFTSASDGTYKVILAAKSVKDIKKVTNAAATTLGSFKVSVAAVSTGIPSLVGTYTGTTVTPPYSPTHAVQLSVTSEDASGNMVGTWTTDAGVVFNFTGVVAANGSFTYSFATSTTQGYQHATGPVSGSGTGTGGGTTALAFSFSATSSGVTANGTMNVTKA